MINIKRATVGLTAVLLVAGAARAADTYQIDPAHTTVGFSVAHLVINEVHGRFKEFDGTIVLDADANAVTSAQGTIQTKSIDTGIEKRDQDLRSPSFFDASQYPTITFQSKRVEKQDRQNVVVGDFTMHGVTKEIVLPYTVKGPIKDPWGKTRIGLKASIVLKRQDYGLTYNKVLEAGGLVVGSEIQIQLDVEAVKQEPEKK